MGRNVFEDLGFENADELQQKAALTFEIYKITCSKGLNVLTLEERLGATPEEAKNLCQARHTDFTVYQLQHFLEILESLP